AHCCDRAGMQRAGEMSLLRLEVLARLAEQNPQEYRAAQTAENSGFCWDFDVVVVSMIHHFAVVACFVARIDCHKSAQAAACDGMIKKHGQGAAEHSRPPRERHISAPQVRKPFNRLSRAHPGD